MGLLQLRAFLFCLGLTTFDLDYNLRYRRERLTKSQQTSIIIEEVCIKSADLRMSNKSLKTNNIQRVIC